MASFGPLLQRTREARGVSLDAIANETRLSKRYLLALEQEAIAKLPGGTYNRAYLRTYATFLGLDPEPLLRDYLAEEALQATVTQQDVLATMNRAIDQRQTPSTDGVIARAAALRFGPPVRNAAVAVAAAALIGGGAWLRLRPAPERADAARAEQAPAPAPAVPATPPSTATAAAPREAPAPTSVLAPAIRPNATSKELAQAGVRIAPPVPDVEPAADRGGLSHLAVTGSGVGTAIVGRELVGQADSFAVGSRVVFWTHVVGGRAGDTIDHVWLRDGSVIGAASLSVGSSDWRTQSRRVLDPAGDWVVEARDADGHVLARHEFRTATQ